AVICSVRKIARAIVPGDRLLKTLLFHQSMQLLISLEWWIPAKLNADSIIWHFDSFKLEPRQYRNCSGSSICCGWWCCLATFAVQLLAILAQAIIASAMLTLPLRNVASRRTCVVVMVDAMCRRLLDFID